MWQVLPLNRTFCSGLARLAPSITRSSRLECHLLRGAVPGHLSQGASPGLPRSWNYFLCHIAIPVWSDLPVSSPHVCCLSPLAQAPCPWLCPCRSEHPELALWVPVQELAGGWVGVSLRGQGQRPCEEEARSLDSKPSLNTRVQAQARQLPSATPACSVFVSRTWHSPSWHRRAVKF